MMELKIKSLLQKAGEVIPAKVEIQEKNRLPVSTGPVSGLRLSSG
jgi:hypothetical protein